MAEVADGRTIWKVIGASSVGTLIEWYDFYIFGSLATTLAPLFFPAENPTLGLLSTLATFATGFIVRPFGAVIFGRLGDVVGRKMTFLLTLLLMGGSTFAIGLLPTYAQVGALAPMLLLILRMVQGLALGGEYGGAATYVAEHSPHGRRGYYTSFIQTTATLGLFVSLGVILATSTSLGPEAFGAWGWRIPFLVSIVLVIVSYFIRTKMAESPLFQKLKSEGKTSKNPLKESFTNPENRRHVALALFGATMGQGVVWYTGQFYALYYLQTVLLVEKAQASIIIAIALVLGTPFFIFFGNLSDKVGRKPILLSGMVMAALLYFPIYSAMASTVDSAFASKTLSSGKVERKIQPGKPAVSTTTTPREKGVVKEITTEKATPETKKEIRLVTPVAAILVLLVFVQVLFVTMVYGPIAAFLVELFPTRVRYTSLSVPYHIGNGIFGGLVPLIATALEKGTGNRFAGLLYPIAIALICAAIGAKYLKDRRDIRLDAE